MSAIFAILFWGAILFSIFAGRGSRPTAADAFASLARRYRGAVIRTKKFWKPPEVRFPYQGVEVLVRVGPAFGRESDQRFTNVVVPLPEERYSVFLYPLAWHARLFPPMRPWDNVAERWFQGRYVVGGDSPVAARAVLTPAVQLCFDRISHAATDARLSIVGGMLTVSGRVTHNNAAQLARFVDEALLLYRRVLEARTVGIEFLPHALPVNLAQATCQVCGDPLHERIVCCSKCHTPHHFDCWQYNGSCSIYGCGETRYVSVQKVA